MRTLSFAAAALAIAPTLSAQQNFQVFSKESSNRAVLGISTTSGGVRDTIGVLVSDVTTGSPADKAGIQEGDRIVSINDVDLRLAPADAGDKEMGGIMGRRLAHALAKHAPGDVVELRVYHDGQFVTRKVTTGKASEVFVIPATLGNLDDNVLELRAQDGRNLLDLGQLDRARMQLQHVRPLLQRDSNRIEIRLDNGPHRI